MSSRAFLWTLWGASLLTVPMPFFLVETGAVPTARLAQLTVATLSLLAVEGDGGAVGIGVGLLAAQTVLASLALLAIAWLAARALRAAPRSARAALAAAVVTLLLAASLIDIYVTPFRTRSLKGNIFEAFE